MKSQGINISIGRITVTLFSVFKFTILTCLVILFVNITYSLFYSSIDQQIFKLSSSSKFFPIPLYQSKSNTLQGFYSPHLANLSSNQNSVSSLLLLQSSPPKLNQSSIFSSLPSAFSSLNSIDNSTSISTSIKNLNNSSIPYKSYPQTLIQNSSSSAHNNNFNSTKTSLNPQKQILRERLFPKGCDLSKGEWIEDQNAPYYTNSTCWMIQEHQNCIKYGRNNLDFLKWRWKPHGCELPLFDPIMFLELMKGNILAFIGDSLARNQMQSLMCLLSRIAYPEEIPSSEENLTIMFYQNHNFSIYFFWSPFLIRAEESNHTFYNFPSYNLFLDEPDPVWPAHLPKFHYVVINTGNWYTRPAILHLNRTLVGCHYCPIPNAPFMSLRRALRHAFRTALSSLARGFKGLTVVRTVSPSHFEGGEWNKGGDCVRTEPFRGGEAPRMEGVEREIYEEQLKEFWKAKWEGSEVGLEFRLLDATKAMLMRADGHPSKYGHKAGESLVMYNDCVHWCLPGPVDMWNDFLFQILSI